MFLSEHLEKLFHQAMEREHAQYAAFAKTADYHAKIATEDVEAKKQVKTQQRKNKPQ